MGTRCVAARVSDDPYVYRYLFVDLYEWAGELRTVVLAKTDLFCLPEHIESYGAEIFGKLAEEHQPPVWIMRLSSSGSPTTSATCRVRLAPSA